MTSVAPRSTLEALLTSARVICETEAQGSRSGNGLLVCSLRLPVGLCFLGLWCRGFVGCGFVIFGDLHLLGSFSTGTYIRRLLHIHSILVQEAKRAPTYIVRDNIEVKRQVQCQSHKRLGHAPSSHANKGSSRQYQLPKAVKQICERLVGTVHVRILYRSA